MESKQTGGCPQCREAMERAKMCIRERPLEAAFTSLGAGFLLAHLPLRALARLVLRLLKPAVILYGLYRLAGDIPARHGVQDAEI